jgi:hypothetical protein
MDRMAPRLPGICSSSSILGPETGCHMAQAVMREVSEGTGLDAYLPDREGQRTMSVGARLVGLIGMLDEAGTEGEIRSVGGAGVRHYFYHLTLDGHRGKQRAAAPERWSVYADDHIVKLFWAPLGSLPEVAHPQNTYLDYVLRELGYALQG